VRLIPSLDLRGGAVVRLERGAFASERRYGVDPASWLERFAAAGARLVHVVDLDGARDGFGANAATIAGLLGRGVELQIAGGVRSAADVRRWLDAGAARVVVGSAALERPDEVARWLAEAGPDRVVLAFDVRRGADGARRLAARGWRVDSPWALADAVERFRAAGLRHALATAIERDGTLDGPSLELLETVCAVSGLPVLAAGGIRSSDDLASVAAIGCEGAIVGRALLEGLVPLTALGSRSDE
jgi:phosphoribosylformimino-5-aminoimidazole carboxamide ribotide isomerase